MKQSTIKGERILALDPMYRDLGFAVLEGGRLIGRGVKTLRENSTLAVVRRLLADYQPTAIVIPDAKTARHPDRRRTLRRFTNTLASVPTAPDVPMVACSTARVRDYFAPMGAYTKHQIAELLANEFPELRPWLPKKRASYDKENPHFGIFDALALALVLSTASAHRT